MFEQHQFDDTDERCVNSVNMKIEEYSDTDTNQNPFTNIERWNGTSKSSTKRPFMKNTFVQNENLYSSDVVYPQRVSKGTTVKDKLKSKTKLLQKELQNSSKALQESIHISYTLLNEVHRLDNATADLLFDKERLTDRNYSLTKENEYLKAKLRQYEETKFNG